MRTMVTYENQNVYIGIDVHKNTYTATCVHNNQIIKKYSTVADPAVLISSISQSFKGGKIFTAYEAGFCGFYLHRKLITAGFTSIVINPASVLVAANDQVKTDKKDSQKIALQLAAGQLRGIYCPTEEEEKRRSLTRTREQIIKQRSRLAIQIKMKLMYHGLFSSSIDVNFRFP